MLDWQDVGVKAFLNRRDKARVKSLRKFYNTDTKVRTITIKSNAAWRDYSAGALLPWFKMELGWSYPYASNYTVGEYALAHPSNLWNKEIIIMSVYHTLLNARLIVDGCHRAIALESTVNKDKAIPLVKVIEAYGSQVHAIFSCDFCNIVKDRLLYYATLPLSTKS